MHARVTSVSFLCVNLNKQGSREPQTIKLKRTKVHAFFVPHTKTMITTNIHTYENKNLYIFRGSPRHHKPLGI